MDIIAVFDRHCFTSFLQDCVYDVHWLYVSHKLISSCWVLSFCKWYYLFTLSFLSNQARHGRNIVSYFYLFICCRAKCLSSEQWVGSSARVYAMCSSCSLQKYLERWPAAFYEAGRSVSVLMMGFKIPRIKLNTVHLYQYFSMLCLINSSKIDVRIIAGVCGLPNSRS